MHDSWRFYKAGEVAARAGFANQLDAGRAISPDAQPTAMRIEPEQVIKLLNRAAAKFVLMGAPGRR